MDRYGFGSAALMALHLYEIAQRGTGRTTSMLDSATDIDAILCLDAREAERLRRELHRRDKKTVVIRCDLYPSGEIDTERLAGLRVKGRILFDHALALALIEASVHNGERYMTAFSLRHAKGRTPDEIAADNQVNRARIARFGIDP